MSEQAYSRDGERYFSDIEDLGLEPGDGYFVGDQVEIQPGQLVRDFMVGEILEKMDEALYDEVGEVAEDAISLSEEDADVLHNLIVDFMNSRATVSCYKVVNIREEVSS